MLKEYELQYRNKQSEKDLLTLIPSANLQSVATLSTPRLLTDSDWVNMLILGDNLLCLRALMSNNAIKGM